MDNGPFRVQRPASRPVSSGPESTPRPLEEQRPTVVNEEPKKVHRPNTQSRFEIENKGRNKLVIAIIGVVIAIVLGVIGWFAWSGMQGGATAIDSSKYQAVFFTNGQVYFGKLASMNSEYMKLTDVYYLQTQSQEDTDSDNPQQASADQNANTTLIKLGDEIHGPEDEMIISKDQILFYENLKTDGKVSESISKFKNPN
jgi:hypothetical protein